MPFERAWEQLSGAIKTNKAESITLSDLLKADAKPLVGALLWQLVTGRADTSPDSEDGDGQWLPLGLSAWQRCFCGAFAITAAHVLQWRSEGQELQDEALEREEQRLLTGLAQEKEKKGLGAILEEGEEEEKGQQQQQQEEVTVSEMCLCISVDVLGQSIH